MAIGDRVKIGDGSTFDNTVTVPVYAPKVDAQGELIIDHYKSAIIQRLGGVKGGTTGVICGPSLRVHRTMLYGEGTHTAAMGGVDLVHVFPVQLDHYQQVGWFPAGHLRVVGGGDGLNISDKR